MRPDLSQANSLIVMASECGPPSSRPRGLLIRKRKLSCGGRGGRGGLQIDLSGEIQTLARFARRSTIGQATTARPEGRLFRDLRVLRVNLFFSEQHNWVARIRGP